VLTILAKLEADAKRNWDIFYKNNKTNFYKDRHYIKFEFPEVTAALTKPAVLLDAGCGVGNGFYPLLAEFPLLKVNCFDFSPRAVDFVKQNELFSEERVQAKVCDLVNDPEIPFELGTADFGIMLFVLSAISPENYD